jgi:uncharacterized protein (TIRG00374 family)
MNTLRRGEVLVGFVLILFIGVFALGSMFAGVGAVKQELARLDWSIGAVLIGCSLINFFLRGWRWDFFGRALDIRLPAWRVHLYYMAGFALAATPGKVGSALRLWLLKRGHGYAFVRTAPMYVLDQVTDLIAIFMLMLLGFGAFSNHETSVILMGGVVAGVLTLAFKPSWMVRVIKGIYALTGKRLPRLFAKLVRLVRLARLLMNIRTITPTTLLSIIGWGAEIVALWLLLHHLGADVTFQQAAFVFGFATIVGAFTLLPGGIGGNEITMVGLLMLLGVEKETAVAATAVIRVTTLWFGVGIGFIMVPPALRVARPAKV